MTLTLNTRDDDQLEPSGEKDPIVHFLLGWCFGWVHGSDGGDGDGGHVDDGTQLTQLQLLAK